MDEFEYYNAYWIVSTFPESQGSISPESAFEVQFKRPVDLTLLSNSNFGLDKKTSDSPVTFTVVTDAFETIDIVDKYDSISRTIILTPKVSLDASTEYLLTVKDLVDTVSNTQTEDHIIHFVTNVADDLLDIPDSPDIDHIIIEDYSLISPPVPSGYSDSRVTCSIPTGTLNVASSTSTFTLAFTAAVTTANVIVTEEDLDTGISTVLAATVTQNGTSFLVTVVLPNQAAVGETAVYVRENCVYTVDAIYTTFEFTGTFDPFFVPLSSFIPFTSAPHTDPIGWARIVYEFSKEIRARMGGNANVYEADKVEELKQFTKYFILAFLQGASTNDSFMLGDLQVTTGVKNNIDYKDMMNLWETKLFGRVGVIKSVDVFGPRAETFARVNPSQRMVLEKSYGVFDRRFPY